MVVSTVPSPFKKKPCIMNEDGRLGKAKKDKAAVRVFILYESNMI